MSEKDVYLSGEVSGLMNDSQGFTGAEDEEKIIPGNISCHTCSKHTECPHCGCGICLIEEKDPEQDDSPCDEYDG